MIKEANTHDIKLIESFLKIENDEFMPLSMPNDIFVMRMRAAYRANGINSVYCKFYMVSKGENEPDGIICIDGANAFYAGELQDADEMESFLGALKIRCFKSNNMLLPGWEAVPLYIMKREKSCDVGVYVAPVMDKPDFWELSKSDVLSDIDSEAWYGKATRLTNAKQADIRAIALSIAGKAQYVSTAGIYALDDNNAYITAVETKEEHRGCGYASTLISVLTKAHKQKDFYLLCKPNKHKFYERLGFAFVRPVCMYLPAKV